MCLNFTLAQTIWEAGNEILSLFIGIFEPRGSYKIVHINKESAAVEICSMPSGIKLLYECAWHAA